MSEAATCPICKCALEADDEITWPTFWERGREVQYFTHTRCFDRIRDRLRAAMASSS